ncbi:unnamed protein product [Parnassius apollo]|uniref:(apollo) hypothetical protein n=1 Tax=Parnassius apollo TaxID=110799 RepID=A0A8S3Y0P8_PARAO|nr:unnamed protein product [Parnassius apollo]
MKGVTAILRNWPEYWWSSFKYLWMGLGMIAIIVLIVYNSVVAFSMLPPTYTKMLKSQNSYNSVDNILSEKLSTYGIYMHIFTKSEDKVNLDDFLPYIEIMCKKYKTFKFNLIVVTHETIKSLDYINDEINNDVALNMLWSDKSFDNDYKVIRSNLAISYVSLNKYLKNPMLQKISKSLSNEFIEFLVRAYSIWEKGGLAFNPIILTPKSPYPFYVEKIQNLLNIRKQELKTNKNLKHTKELRRPKKVLNNIRDIIDALDTDDRSSNNLQYNLTEVEDKFYKEIVNNTDVKVLFTNDSFSDILNLTSRVKNYKNKNPLVASGLIQREINNISDRNFDAESNSLDNLTVPHLLPMFLQYLLPKKESVEADKKSNIPINLKNYQPDIPLSKPNEISKGNSAAAFIKNKNRDLFENNETKSNSQDYETDAQLTVDLKGNLIASNTPCHALVGNFLSHAAYHNEEKTLTDFIITELTVFCKGVISSCKAVDVILS